VPEVTLTHLYSANTGLLLRDYYPASPGGGALPAETVTHGYETGFDLPQGLGSTLAAYGQKVTYDAFFQVTQEEIGNVTSNAYITSTYDPHTGALTDAQTENTVASATPTPFDDTSYTYDAAGNITSEADAHQWHRRHRHFRDPVLQLRHPRPAHPGLDRHRQLRRQPLDKQRRHGRRCHRWVVVLDHLGI
jgi:hypothetical protein